MPSWFKMLNSGEATKSKIPASTAISGGNGASVKWKGFDLVDYTGNVGKATEAYSSGPPAFAVAATVGSTPANAYLLPWGGDKICYTRIQTAHKIFLTHAMNGCGVIISGTRTSPTVVHANVYDQRRINDFEGEEKAEKRREIYSEFADYLETQGIVSGTDIATWYPGTDYMGARSGVFGVFKTSSWVFYGHANAGSSSTTKLIWPEDATDEFDNSASKCCFITTAVCRSLDLPDDCMELETLRWFRDEVLTKLPHGREDIATYYATAPRIVEALDRRPDAAASYRSLYVRTIQPAVVAIQQGRMHEAYELYRSMMHALGNLK